MGTVPEWLQNAANTVVVFVPKLVLFLIILLVGWLLAKALEKVVDAILEKVGFDRAVERGAVGRAMRNSEYDASSILGKVVYYAVMLLALQLAFGVFGPNAISDLITRIIAFLPQLFVALLIVIIGSAIAGAVADLIRNTTGGLASGRIMATVAQVFIIGLAVIAALNQMGIALTVTLPVLVTVLATVGGIAIVGVGGGLILPMRERWERWLVGAEQERARLRVHRDTNPTGPVATHPTSPPPASDPSAGTAATGTTNLQDRGHGPASENPST